VDGPGGVEERRSGADRKRVAKARFPLSDADAFAAATALRASAQLVTADDEVPALDEILDIVWLPS